MCLHNMFEKKERFINVWNTRLRIYYASKWNGTLEWWLVEAIRIHFRIPDIGCWNTTRALFFHHYEYEIKVII